MGEGCWVSQEREMIWGKGWVTLMTSRESDGESNGNPLQYSCLENPMDGGAWPLILIQVLGVMDQREGRPKSSKRNRGREDRKPKFSC